MEKVDQQYKDGFESGYWLAKGNHPQLSQIMQNKNADPKFLDGMKAGQKELQREKVREELKQIDVTREKNKGKDHEKEI